MCAVGCEYVASLDFCAHSGKVLGGKWELLVCNEENNLIGSLLSTSTKLEAVSDWLKQLKARRDASGRSTFNAKVAIIDNVPPSMSSETLSEMEKLIMGALGVEWVGQDRFHVGHSFSPKFNNTDPRFFDLIILGWRHATVERDRDCMRLVDEKLMAGEIKKSCTYRKVKYEIQGHYWRQAHGEWQLFGEAELVKWKNSGLYHELFTTSPNVIVPEHVLSPAALDVSVSRYIFEVIEQIFHPANDTGYRAPVKINRSTLADDVHDTHRIFTNALKRIKKCSPPTHLEAWYRTGATDQNGIDIWKPYFHSCGVENWNSQQMSFVTSGNTTKEHATACFYEGNAKLITKKQVAAGRQEDLVTSNITTAVRCNAWAGFGVDDTDNDDAVRKKAVRLLANAPFNISLPPPVAPGEICIQPLSRFDVTSRRSTPAAMRLAFSPSANIGLSKKAALLKLALLKPVEKSCVAVDDTDDDESMSEGCPIYDNPAVPIGQTDGRGSSSSGDGYSSDAASGDLSPYSYNQRMVSKKRKAEPLAQPEKQQGRRKKAVAGRNPKKNPWWCACSEGDRTGRGARNHWSKCPVQIWLRDPTESPREPIEGDIVEGLAGSTRAGKKWVYVPRNRNTFEWRSM